MQREAPQKLQARYSYKHGPIFFVGQQIVRQMQQSGYDAKIFQPWRTPSEQQALKDKGASKAGALDGAHVYGLAVDIIHKTEGWPPDDSPFWENLNIAARIVAERFKIDLAYGYDWGWDSAHIELEHYRSYRDELKPQLKALLDAVPATDKAFKTREAHQDWVACQFISGQMDKAFAVELPRVWAQRPDRKKGR